MPKSIGIVGGAGPLAGAFLLERVLRLCQERYGCYRDADYPEIILLSYPFSEMLTSYDEEKIKKELRVCLNRLRGCGAELLAIACNTLHAFVGEEEGLIYLPDLIAEVENPLVLCTSTSRQYQVYPSCRYSERQEEVDEIIDQILKKGVVEVDRIQALVDGTTILGCTELSLFSKQLKGVIDPLELLADTLVTRSFL